MRVDHDDRLVMSVSEEGEPHGSAGAEGPGQGRVRPTRVTDTPRTGPVVTCVLSAMALPTPADTAATAHATTTAVRRCGAATLTAP
jgi:hypothetical protein